MIYVPCEVHRIVQDPQYINRTTSLAANAKQNDMPPPPTNVQRAQARCDLVAMARTGDVWPPFQPSQGSGQQFGIGCRLRCTEPTDGPAQDVIVIRFGYVRQPYRPVTVRHSDDRPTTLSARSAS